MPADWWPSFLVFSPANMTVFSVAFLSHAEMTFVYQEYSVYKGVKTFPLNVEGCRDGSTKK